MTVASTARKQTFSGGQASLTFTFRALTTAPTDIKVKKTLISTGVDTALTYTTEYTAAISADGIGGVVTVSPTISTLYNLVVYRETTDKQESDYDDYNQFPANTLETDIDRRTMVSQETAENIDRSIKLPISSTLTGLTLPNPSTGKTLKWLVSGSTVTMVNSDVDIDTAIAAALASQYAAATSATTALAAQTASEAARESSRAAATTSTTQATASATSATTSSSHATSSLGFSLAAATSATTALGYKNTAGTSATNALASEYAAGTYTTLALSYKNAAGTSATNALASELAASTSATSALASSNSASTSASTALSTLYVAINAQTANYTLALTDVNKLVDMNSSGTITLTIPSSGTVNFVTGSVIALRQLGAGKVQITTAGGVTLRKEVGAKTTGQYAVASLVKTGADEWLTFGALEA